MGPQCHIVKSAVCHIGARGWAAMHAPRVAPVDRDAADAIQASTMIPSLAVAVEELVRNAAEAGANVVDVHVRARDGFISARDDGGWMFPCSCVDFDPGHCG